MNSPSPHLLEFTSTKIAAFCSVAEWYSIIPLPVLYIAKAPLFKDAIPLIREEEITCVTSFAAFSDTKSSERRLISLEV